MLDAYIIHKIKEMEERERQERESEQPALYIEEYIEPPKPKEPNKHEITIDL